jgi:hypothetical protein
VLETIKNKGFAFQVVGYQTKCEDAILVTLYNVCSVECGIACVEGDLSSTGKDCIKMRENLEQIG